MDSGAAFDLWALDITAAHRGGRALLNTQGLSKPPFLFLHPSSLLSFTPPTLLLLDLCMSYQERQDEPFDHEALMHGHQRSGSSANLLEGENTLKVDDYDHGDEFYDTVGPSKTNLYDDPERSLPYDKEAGAKNYQNFGMCAMSRA